MSGTNLSKNEISFLERINLVVEGENYAFDDFAFKNAQLVLDNLLQEDYNRLLILHPTGVLLTSFASTIIPIALAKHDVEQASRDITEHLHVGDKVKRDGCLGEVSNITEIFGRNYVVVKFNDLIESIPFERAWRLQKYEGNAVNLHNFNPKPGKKVNKQKAVLCNVLDLEDEEFPPVLLSKTLIVSEKQLFINNIEKIQLGGSPYTSVFPTGYFKDQNQFERMGTDPLQRRPIVCVVSSLEVACEMVEKDPSIKAVIIHDLKKLRGNYIYLERIQNKLTNILLLQEIHKFEEDDIDKIANMGFKIFHWSYENVKSLALSLEPTSDFRNQVGRSHRTLLSIANPSRDKSLIEGEASDLLKQVKLELDKIKMADFESDYKIPFIARSFDALLNLRAIPVPLNEVAIGTSNQDYFKKLVQVLQELHVNLRLATYGDTLQSIGDVIEKINRLIAIHSQSNPKHGAFTISDQLGTNDCIVVPKVKHKDIIEKWLQNRRGNKHGISVLTLNELSSANRFFNTALFTGWFGEKHAKLLLTPMAHKQYFLLYPFEQEWMEKNETWISRYLSRFSIKEEYHVEVADCPSEYDLENYLSKMIGFQQNYYQGVHLKYLDDTGTLTDCSFVEFEDDYYAFLTEGYNCRCLDKDGEIVVKKKVSELRPGDTLVFIKDSSEDIFEKLAEAVETSSPKIREQVEMSQLWRTALINYKEKNSYGYETIRNQLAAAGLQRVTTTIKLWLHDENQIGPDDEGIRAIAKLTGDYELNSKLDQVIIACSKIRSLHVQLGRYLAQSISSAVTGTSLGNEDRILKKLSENLSQYAIAVSVRAISTEKTSVPSSRVNVLIEK